MIGIFSEQEFFWSTLLCRKHFETLITPPKSNLKKSKWPFDISNMTRRNYLVKKQLWKSHETVPLREFDVSAPHLPSWFCLYYGTVLVP